MRCAYCHDAAEDVVGVCGRCGVALHPECWDESPECPTLGCAEQPVRDVPLHPTVGWLVTAVTLAASCLAWPRRPRAAQIHEAEPAVWVLPPVEVSAPEPFDHGADCWCPACSHPCAVAPAPPTSRREPLPPLGAWVWTSSNPLPARPGRRVAIEAGPRRRLYT